MQVGCDHRGQRDQTASDGVHRVVVQQPMPARGDHHGIEDVVAEAVVPDALGHGPDQLGGGEHSRLHRRRGQITDHGVDLGADDVLGNGVYGVHP